MPKSVISFLYARFTRFSSLQSKNPEPRTQNPWGFTLIELMVAISIVAILATVGLVMYNSVQAGARDSKRMQDLAEIQKAIQLHYNSNASLPANLTAVASYFQKGAAPTDPKTAASYNYITCASGANSTKYFICSTLESCGSKCNYTSLPADACANLAVPAASQTIYCTSN